MKHLNQITISNIRRFKENVRIPISKGATIFLAPNGTGKTAIFEAVELALTGAVKRLPAPPDVLIRDTTHQSFIRLDFEGDKYCEANFFKGTLPVLSGHHKELFNGVPDEDIPYLLRLTHFLNQRNDEWLVQNPGQNAGSQLDHLAIGRDAIQANGAMIATKKAATSRIAEARQNLKNAEIQLQNWNELIGSREKPGDWDKNIMSRPVIMENLNVVADFLSTNHLTKDEINNLHAAIEAFTEMLSKKTFLDKDRLLALESLKALIDSFDKLNHESQNVNANIETNREAKKDISKQLDDQVSLFLKASKELLAHETSLEELRKNNALWMQFTDLDASIKSKGGEIELLDNSLKNDKAKVSILAKDLDISQQAERLQGRLEAISKLIGTDQIAINANEQLILGWINRIQELEILRDDGRRLDELFIHAEELLAAITSTLNLQMSKLAAAQIEFNSLNQTSDTIRNAVGLIASALPSSTDICPVCRHEYPQGELQTRIARALEAINPLLNQAAATLEQQRKVVADSSVQKSSMELEIQQIKSQIETNEVNRKKINDDIDQLMLFKIYGAQTPDEAQSKVTEAKRKLAAAELDRTAIQELLKAFDGTSSYEVVSAEYQSLKRIVDEKLGQVTALENVIKELSEQRNDIDIRLSSVENIDIIRANINDLTLVIEKARIKLNGIKNVQDALHRTLTQTNEILVREEDRSRQLGVEMAKLRSIWNTSGLQGTPNESALTSKRDELTVINSRNDKVSADIIDLSNQLIKLKAVDMHLDVERRITVLRGSKAEVEFSEELQASLIQAQVRVTSLEEKQAALESFSANLMTQVDKVNEQIIAINPLWNKLLKRVVVDPKFADTIINSYSHRKKQHADFTVQIHNKAYTASHIASEAQIADLQFTFLLSMAQKYLWSPWRSLLLDDPTQHHDLVHASSIFDLLRDYIVDHEFQILLATHDSIQANFFIRKLRNDGIEARVVKLRPTANGVHAEF